MKAQFMVISVILLGVTLMTVGAVIEETQTREFSGRTFTPQVIMMQSEAEGYDFSTSTEKDNLDKMIYMSAYNGSASFNSADFCDNISLSRGSESYLVEC